MKHGSASSSPIGGWRRIACLAYGSGAADPRDTPEDVPIRSETRPMQLKDDKLFRLKGHIDGAWVGADGGGTITVRNPATGEELGTVPRMGATETKRAITAA